ncbi:PREDICTED: meiosis-specific nuclear structural protein 1 isoform X2 [Papilio polytes]|nr:PREDICTED: meiosis-specific nuclear structural protein 1 isoform X2 [Papilio polytes]
MDDSHIGRHLAQIKQEAAMERDFQERTDHSALVNARTQKEIALASEIAKHNQEEISQLQRRHYLRERDPELRTLLRRLQDGYVCRDLKQQMLHNKYKKLQDEAEDRRQNRILMSALAVDSEAVMREEQEAMEKKAKLLLEMQQQLVDRQRVRQCQFEETLIEKKMLEEVMRTIADEDHREVREKRELAVKLNKEIETFKRARDAWKEKQKKLLVIEERNIENQIKEAGDRSAAIIAERERKFREREMLNEKIAAKIMADRAAILEREEIIRSLQEQEYLEKNVKEDIAEMTKSSRSKQATEAALSLQIQARRKLAQEQKEKEANFRKENEAQAEEQRQQLLQQARRQRQQRQQYGRQLLQQMAEDASRRQKMKQHEDEEARYVFDYDKAWLSECAEERKRIISEHAAHVLGYVQPATLRHEELLQLPLGAAARTPATFPKCNSQCRVLREY